MSSRYASAWVEGPRDWQRDIQCWVRGWLKRRGGGWKCKFEQLCLCYFPRPYLGRLSFPLALDWLASLPRPLLIPQKVDIGGDRTQIWWCVRETKVGGIILWRRWGRLPMEFLLGWGPLVEARFHWLYPQTWKVKIRASGSSCPEDIGDTHDILTSRHGHQTTSVSGDRLLRTLICLSQLWSRLRLSLNLVW